ncbi:MAG: hypothetical protein DWI04_04670 [Planctomycetota bacterium]|nr:MAG: hypothetical protein DWI04_04670 [Planctomycetota bacterium]
MHRILFLQPVRKTSVRSSCRRIGVAVAVLCAAVILQGRVATANFDVHGTSSTRAEAIVRHAEQVRERAFETLLGASAPSPWTVRCEIHLHATEESFAEAVGGPPDGARGATAIEFAEAGICVRRIDLMDDDPAAVPDALAHELVHVILADHFTTAPPPRWADEGLAVLFDDEAKQAGHARDFAAARRAGMTWSASHLLAMEEYPREPHRQRVFYGQSAALVRWLIDQRGAATLLSFLDDAAAIGEGAALERHYGFSTVAALERAWLSQPAETDIGVD